MGRWASTQVCAHYLAQGHQTWEAMTVGQEGHAGEASDPIKRVWFWHPVASRQKGGRDAC